MKQKKKKSSKPAIPSRDSLHLGEIFLPHDFDRFEKWAKGAYASFPRVALLGRSNVGKSTLVNLLLETRTALVSKKPGKTRGIHFYLDTKRKCIWVDVPGYGFAARSQSERTHWAAIMQRYLDSDENLMELWLLWDARHGPTENDLEALRYFQKFGVSLRIIMTKTDQLKTQKMKSQRMNAVHEILQRRYSVSWISQSDTSSIRALFQMNTAE